MSLDNFIFGYGSLICEDSRARTGASGQAIPVRIKGVERQWNAVYPKFEMSAVGAISNPNGACNGVIFQVPEEEIPKFDEREVDYSRIKLDREDISAIMQQSVPQGNIWVYVANSPGIPDTKSPIVQSYIDVILTGCLNINEEFAREFISSTTGWDSPWINDRENPVYMRAMKEVHYRQKIDQILKELVPEANEVLK
jgi:hypothetical protein